MQQDEDAQERVAAAIRGVHAEALYAIREMHSESVGGSIPKRSARVFAPLSSRNRASAASGARVEIGWSALLHTVFRRFAGELLVEGKLLNQEEIEVHRLMRTGRSNQDGISLAGSSVRFVVRCVDAPTARIGSAVSATVVRTHTRMLPDRASALPVATYTPEREKLRWNIANDQDITALKAVYGFNVELFAGRATQRRHHVDNDASDEEDGGTNAVIMNDTTFSDLRGVSRMMEANHIAPSKWISLVIHQPLAAECIDAQNPWSYVSLGAAQKKLWARERVDRGDALRAKGRLKECVAEYTSAVHLEEANERALLQRGRVFIELRQYEDAIRDFERLLEIGSENDAATDGLLRAKSKLGHSKRIATPSPYSRSFPSEPDANGRRSILKQPHAETTMHTIVPAAKQEEYTNETVELEEDLLRRLLEEEESTRKRSRKTLRSRRNDRSSRERQDSSPSDAESHDSRQKRSGRKRSKKAKKSSRKKHKKSSRHHDDTDDDHGHRRKSSRRDDSSSSSSSDDSDSCKRRKSKRSRRFRSRSRSRSRQRARRSVSATRSKPAPVEEILHPILARKPHRLWN